MAHYYSEKQDSDFRQKIISERIRGVDFSFCTASGVFSKNRIDRGTKALAENCLVNDGWKVLDLGCGYGVIGIVIKKLFPKCEVVLSDVNERALKLSEINARLNNVEVKIIKSFLFDNIQELFDTVIVNPPQAAGLDICYKMIEQSYQHLKTNGLFQLVARHNKGGSRLEKRMLEVFENISSKRISTYRIYTSKKENNIKNLTRKLGL
ncbi:MAG: class I SAM-dependent methyltransferase [Candidatus Woesearchaeota archaeon]